MCLSRKLRYAINAQVVGGQDNLIYDINLGSPGSFSTWRCSSVKPILEGHIPLYKLAVDSGIWSLRIMYFRYKAIL